MLGALNLEVLWSELHGRASAAAEDGIANGATNIEIERIAEFIGLGGVIAFMANADARDFMLTGFVHIEFVKQLVERVLTKLANASWCEFELSFLVLDEPRFFETA